MTVQEHPSDHSGHAAERAERRWATLAVLIVVALAALAAVIGIHNATMPQTRVETIDPKQAAISGEFIESNLGSQLEPDGSVTVRALGQRYSFTPSCITVPTDTPITIRATSADVIHGILIEGTNINTMLVPGYVSVITAQFQTPGEHLMPCQEFCSIGHEGMWGRVKVIDKTSFKALADKSKRVSCVGE
jgi:cytochrome c oxidase subunit II